MMHQRYSGLLLLLSLLLAACSGPRDTTADGTETDVPEFSINVDTWIGYAPLHLAIDKGFFAEEGVDVKLVTTPDVAQRRLILKRGDNQAIAETVDALVLDQSQEVPTVAVLVLDQSNGADGIVATDDIKTIQDLKGKTVAVQKNYVSEAMLNYLLKQNGIPFDAVNTVDTEAGAAGAAFVAGKVPAAVTFEPWLSKAAEREGGHVLLSSKDVLGVVVDILSVHEDYLRENPETVAKVVRGWFKAVEFWKQNPAEANAIMAPHYSVTTEEFAEQVSGIIWPSVAENQTAFDATATGSVQSVADTFIDVFNETGQISADPDMTGAIDPSILQSLDGGQ